VFLQQLPGMLEGYGASEMARDVGSTFAKIAAAAGVALAAGLLLKDRSPAPYLLAVVVSATLAALLCIVSALSPEPPFPFANLIAGTLGSRPSGPFGNPNYFGQFAAFGLVLALGWAWVTRGGGRGRSWLLAACAGILAGGLLVAQSRGALLSVLIGVVAMGFARSRRTGVIITVVCLALGAALLPLLLEARMSSRAGFYGVLAADSQLASDSGRLDRILEGPQLFVSAPLFGVGLFQYILITGDYPHNWYMLILAEQGLVGIALWALILGWLVRRIRRAEQAPRLVGSGLLGTFLVGCLFLEPSTDGQGSIAPVVAFVAVVACRWPRARRGGEGQARPAAAHPAAGAWPGLATSPAPGERPA
jgi:O-antigen ligase